MYHGQKKRDISGTADNGMLAYHYLRLIKKTADRMTKYDSMTNP